MKLSAPIHVLKINAKKLKKMKSITMTQALDEIAHAEGYSSWGLLQSKANEMFPKKSSEILEFLNPGDFLVIGSRPGLGKTTFSLQILMQAAQEKRQCYLFSLEYNHKDVAKKIAEIDTNIGQNDPYLQFNFSDEICAQYIIDKTRNKISKGSIILVDYLQILDQKRTMPELQEQILVLKNFAIEMECIFIFISQIDRKFENSGRDLPGLEDIRLPNPIDLSLFNKAIFIHNGKKFFTRPRSIEII